MKETLENLANLRTMALRSLAWSGVLGGKQLGLTDDEQTTAKKRTIREKFLAEMEAEVPCRALIDRIEPYYSKTSKKGGWPP
jgi:IS5 family transposase